MVGVELLSIDAQHGRAPVPPGAALEPGLLAPRRRRVASDRRETAPSDPVAGPFGREARYFTAPAVRPET